MLDFVTQIRRFIHNNQTIERVLQIIMNNNI
jgi:hypothetical protein